MIALLEVIAGLALLTGGGAAIVALLLTEDDRELHAGWSFLAGSAIAALLLHLPLAIDGRLPKLAFFLLFVLFFLLAAGPGLKHIRRAGIRRFFGLDLLGDLPFWGRIVALAMILLAASVAFEPFAGWDERAIYGLKARILYYEGSVRVEGFTDKDIVHSQARYPLLIPVLEASMFTIKDSPDDRFLKLLFLFFGLSVVMIVAEESGRLGGARTGALWGLLLITTPFLIGPGEGRGMSGYADLPLAAYVTGAAVLLARAFDRPNVRSTLLSGLLLGAALMTKQEGAIWAVALGFGFLLTFWLRRPSVQTTLPAQAAAMAIPAFLMSGISEAARRWIPSSIWTEHYESVLNLGWISQAGSRPLPIAPFVFRELGNSSHWAWGWPLVLCGLVVLRRPKVTPAAFFWRIAAATVFAAFLCALIFTPDQVYWQLETAFPRLLLQLFPLAILILAEQVTASGWIDQGLSLLESLADSQKKLRTVPRPE